MDLKNDKPKMIRRRVYFAEYKTLCLTHDRSLFAFISLRSKQQTCKLGKAKQISNKSTTRTITQQKNQCWPWGYIIS